MMPPATEEQIACAALAGYRVRESIYYRDAWLVVRPGEDHLISDMYHASAREAWLVAYKDLEARLKQDAKCIGEQDTDELRTVSK